MDQETKDRLIEELTIGGIETMEDFESLPPNMRVHWFGKDAGPFVAVAWNPLHWEYVGKSRTSGLSVSWGEFYGDEFGWFVPLSPEASTMAYIDAKFPGHDVEEALNLTSADEAGDPVNEWSVIYQIFKGGV